MKTEKGITLTSLVIYIAVTMIVIGIMAMVSTFFFNNVNIIKNQEDYAPEFNKFAMFFVQDVKNNKTATINETGNIVTLEDGNIYTYNQDEKKIYRNNTVIAKDVEKLQFTLENYTVNNTTKNIINVDISIGEVKTFSKQMEFVLKYW